MAHTARPKAQKIQRLMIIACTSLFSIDAIALSNYYSNTGFEIEYNDNALKKPNSELADTEYRAYLDFGLKDYYSNGDVAIDYRLEQQYHDERAFDDRTLLSGYGEGNLYIVERRLKWFASYSGDEQTIDSALPDTANNRTEENIFTTGPTVLFQPTPIDNVLLNLRYIKTQYSDIDENDTTTNRINALWNHSRSATQSFYSMLSYSDVTYDDINSEYQHESFRVGYNYASRHFTSGFWLGLSQIKRPEFDDRTNQELGANLNYAFSEMSSLEFSYSREFKEEDTDNFKILSITPTDNDDYIIETNFGAADLYIQTNANLSYRYSFDSTTRMTLFTRYIEIDYLELNEDENETSAGVSFSRNLNPTNIIFSRAQYSEQEFDLNIPTLYKDNFSIGYKHLSSKALTMTGSVFYEGQTDPSGITDYENVGANLSIDFKIQ